jgi:hypothetical protein
VRVQLCCRLTLAGCCCLPLQTLALPPLSFPLSVCYIVEHLTFFSLELDIQFQNYIVDMCSYDVFLELKGIDELTRKMAETQKDVIYPLVYLLAKLVLTLLVATATVERSFSTMEYIKNQLRNWMKDQWMNDCLVTYIESDVFDSIDNEAIMQRFSNYED